MSEKETTKLIKEYIKCVEPEELYKPFIEGTIVPEWVLPDEGRNVYITEDLPTGICVKKVFALDYPNEIFSFFKELVSRNKNHIMMNTKIPVNIPLIVSIYDTVSSNDVRLFQNDTIVDGRFNVYTVIGDNVQLQEPVILPVCAINVLKGVHNDIWYLYTGTSIHGCNKIKICTVNDESIPPMSIELSEGNCKITHTSDSCGDTTFNFCIYGFYDAKLLQFNLYKLSLDDISVN